jgi:hypothetical protein
VDGAFNPGAVVPPGGAGSTFVSTLALCLDGKILVGGLFTVLDGQPRNHLGRLNRDGSLDATFNPGADNPVLTQIPVTSMAVQADGKILVGGSFANLASQARGRIGRLTSGSTAAQSLALGPNGTSAQWNRSGSGPEVEQVTFEQSFDGTNFTFLGNGSRTSSGWHLSGLTLPAGQNFYLRARGRATGGINNGSSGLMESVAQFWRLPPPFLSSVQVLGGGVFQFSFTNTNTTAFTVLASTNVNLPASNWTALGSPISVGGGVYQFTDPTATNHARRFYQLRTP